MRGAHVHDFKSQTTAFSVFGGLNKTAFAYPSCVRAKHKRNCGESWSRKCELAALKNNPAIPTLPYVSLLKGHTSRFYTMQAPK